MAVERADNGPLKTAIHESELHLKYSEIKCFRIFLRLWIRHFHSAIERIPLHPREPKHRVHDPIERACRVSYLHNGFALPIVQLPCQGGIGDGNNLPDRRPDLVADTCE